MATNCQTYDLYIEDMKSKFGTALALAAVLLTGTAAAAINTQALNTPAQSTLGTASTTLLPVDQAAVVVPAPTQATPDASVQASAGSQTQSPKGGSNKSASPKSSATTVTSTSNNTSVVYGNPNPSTGSDDQDDDNEGPDNDGDDD